MKVHDPRHPRHIWTLLTPATTTRKILMVFKAMGLEDEHLRVMRASWENAVDLDGVADNSATSRVSTQE